MDLHFSKTKSIAGEEQGLLSNKIDVAYVECLRFVLNKNVSFLGKCCACWILKLRALWHEGGEADNPLNIQHIQIIQA